MSYPDFLAVWSDPSSDVADIRAGGFPALLNRTGLTANAFAVRYGLPSRTVYGWTQSGAGSRTLPASTLCMLAYIVLYAS